MKRIRAVFFFFFWGFSFSLFAQVYVETEFISASGFRDENNKKVGGSGSSRIVRGGFNVPLSVKKDENDLPTVWALGLGVSYAHLTNNNLSDDWIVPGLFNAQVGLSYIRPITKRWSLMGMLGVGLYTETGNFSKYSFKNILGEGVIAGVWHPLRNLDVGMGIAVNTAFGYPMVFPAIFVDWKIQGRYFVNLSMMNASEVEAGMEWNPWLRLKFVAKMNGMLALVEREGKKKMFTHQYVIVGFQPEFKIGKTLSVPFTVGISAYRAAFYDDRTLRAFFKAMNRDYDPHFSPSFYGSVAIKYGF